MGKKYQSISNGAEGMKKRSHQEWRELIKRWNSSDMTRVSFCKQEGITPATLQYRKSVIERLCGEADQFVELSSDREPGSIEIVCSTGVRVRVPVDMSCERISELAQCLA